MTLPDESESVARRSLGRPSFSKTGRLKKKGANITRPCDQETKNRYNKNDGLSTLVA